MYSLICQSHRCPTCLLHCCAPDVTAGDVFRGRGQLEHGVRVRGQWAAHSLRRGNLHTRDQRQLRTSGRRYLQRRWSRHEQRLESTLRYSTDARSRQSQVAYTQWRHFSKSL